MGGHFGGWLPQHCNTSADFPSCLKGTTESQLRNDVFQSCLIYRVHLKETCLLVLLAKLFAFNNIHFYSQHPPNLNIKLGLI